MENVIDFLSIGYGFGAGYGIGVGSGYDDGTGSGYGSGYSYGVGSGYDDGTGSGRGSNFGVGYRADIKQFKNHIVYYIDYIPTIITTIKHNIAKGFILQKDLTLKLCYVAKVDNYFAHGETVHEAVKAAQDKVFKGMSEDERIEKFVESHNNDIKHAARDLWEWHNKLTGSCEMGRKQFAAERGINIDNDTFTIKEFIEMCENNYGGEIIKKLKKFYN